MLNRTNDESRYVGTNWDAVRVEETNGAHGKSARKVITRGGRKR